VVGHCRLQAVLDHVAMAATFGSQQRLLTAKCASSLPRR
jgi:hypothetical protein